MANQMGWYLSSHHRPLANLPRLELIAIKCHKKQFQCLQFFLVIESPATGNFNELTGIRLTCSDVGHEVTVGASDGHSVT